jgi:hypothetical protein
MEWAHPDKGNHPYDTTILALAPDNLANFVIDNGTAAFEGRYMIGVWLWDLERPSEIMSTASRMVHEIWVPSSFTADAVAGVTDRKVARMLLPVPSQSPADWRGGPPEPGFTFRAGLDYETGFERQNPLGVVQAFRAAFPCGAGPHLVIDATHAASFPAEHAKLIDAVADRPDISVVPDGRGEVFAGPHGHDVGASCYVSLHRSEGTGLRLAQAMRQGVPTIVTSHSFSVELQDGRDSLQVPCTLSPIPESEFRCEPGGRWAEPDLEAAAKAMRLLVEQPDVAMAKARRARDRARRQFSPYRTVRTMRERLSAVDRMRYGVPQTRPQATSHSLAPTA